jgi:hypothetical protein
MLDPGEDVPRFIEIVARIEQAINLRAVARPLLHLVEIAVIRIERVARFLIRPIAHVLEPREIPPATAWVFLQLWLPSHAALDLKTQKRGTSPAERPRKAAGAFRPFRLAPHPRQRTGGRLPGQLGAWAGVPDCVPECPNPGRIGPGRAVGAFRLDGAV